LLSKREKIASGKEIKGILKRRKFKITTPLIQVTAEENNQANSRMAIICRKELGSAVERNRIRRRLEGELIRMRSSLIRCMDAVIIPRSTNAQCKEIMTIIIKKAENESNTVNNH